MKSSKYSCFVSLCWFYCQPSVHASPSSSSSVLKGQYSIPPAPLNGVSDPDGMLAPLEFQTLADRLQNLNVSVKLGGHSHSTLVPIQIVIALVERMVPITTRDSDDGRASGRTDHDQQEQRRIMTYEELLAERMARSFHDAWGVGQVTEWGGTGVLIFISIHDRLLSINRGEALDRILTDSRLDTILNQCLITKYETNFTNALMGMISDMIHYVELGEPTWKEIVLDYMRLEYFILLVRLGIILYGGKLAQLVNKRYEAYARAASQLSEIDRAHAQALQGQYEITSCSICLENFKSSTIGSDNYPLKLLRCGHAFDESCWLEWISTGQRSVTKCPVCKMDIGKSCTRQTSNHHGVRVASTQGTTQNPSENDDDADADANTDANADVDDQMLVLLILLGMRHPDFVSQSQIQQWSSPTYQGSLARDPSFQQRAPQQCQRDGMKRIATSTDDSYRPRKRRKI